MRLCYTCIELYRQGYDLEDTDLEGSLDTLTDTAKCEHCRKKKITKDYKLVSRRAKRATFQMEGVTTHANPRRNSGNEAPSCGAQGTEEV